MRWNGIVHGDDDLGPEAVEAERRERELGEREHDVDDDVDGLGDNEPVLGALAEEGDAHHTRHTHTSHTSHTASRRGGRRPPGGG